MKKIMGNMCFSTSSLPRSVGRLWWRGCGKAASLLWACCLLLLAGAVMALYILILAAFVGAI